MNDKSSTKYLDGAYKEAKSYALNLLKECENTSIRYKETDKFYHEFSNKENVLMALCAAVGVIGLIMHGLAFTYIERYLFSRWNFGVLEGYFSMIYNLFFAGLLVFGGWRLLMLVYSKNAGRELDKIAGLSNSIKSELGKAEKWYKEIAAQGFSHIAGVSVGNVNQYEKTLAEYKDKAQKVKGKTAAWDKLLLCALFTVLLVVHFWILGRYAVSSIAESFSYPSVFVVCCSYFLLFILLYELQIFLFEYLGRVTKLVAVVIYALYQILMGIQMSKYEKLLSVIEICRIDIDGDGPEWMGILEKFVSTGIGIFLIFTSVLGFMFIIRTNAGKELAARENGIEIPMKYETSKLYSKEEVRRGNKIELIAGAAFAVIAPKYMSEILIKGASFGRVIGYFIIGSIWFGISRLMAGEEKRAVYGKRISWVKNSFFFSYMFLTLALVPDFGSGSVLLLILQSVLTVLAFVILAFVV
ncbi:MAG: hypothetical protein NC400_04180 [Clostridium sp.]|nr:hypothetical protein [Clostridium sp.]